MVPGRSMMCEPETAQSLKGSDHWAAGVAVMNLQRQLAQFQAVVAAAGGVAVLDWGAADLVKATGWAAFVDGACASLAADQPVDAHQHQQYSLLLQRQVPGWRPHCKERGMATKHLISELLHNDFFYQHPLAVPLLGFVLRQLARLDAEDNSGFGDASSSSSNSTSRDGSGVSVSTTVVDADTTLQHVVLQRLQSVRHTAQARQAWTPFADESQLPPGAPEIAAAAMLLNQQLDAALASQAQGSTTAAGGSGPGGSDGDTTSAAALVQRERAFVALQPAGLNVVAVQILQPWEAFAPHHADGDAGQEEEAARSSSGQRRQEMWELLFRDDIFRHDSADGPQLQPQRQRDAARSAQLLPLVLDASNAAFMAMHPTLLGRLAARHFPIAQRAVSLLLAQLRRTRVAHRSRRRTTAANTAAATTTSTSTTATATVAAQPAPPGPARAHGHQSVDGEDGSHDDGFDGGGDDGGWTQLAVRHRAVRLLALLGTFSARLRTLCADALALVEREEEQQQEEAHTRHT
jgi:hypothetical protein